MSSNDGEMDGEMCKDGGGSESDGSLPPPESLSGPDDLFGDQGVIKTTTQKGTGWKKPKAESEVLISVTVVSMESKEPVEDQPDLEYTLGSGTLGGLSKAVDEALTKMMKGEIVELKCTSAYAYGDARPEDVMVTLALKEIFEITDISWNKDKSVMKKMVKEGKEWDKPKDGMKVTLKVEAATAGSGSAPIPGFEAKTLEFTVGNGDVCDALEMAVLDMKKSECAVLTITDPRELQTDDKLGLQNVAAERVALTLELTEFEKGKDTWSMSEEEKVAFGTARKEVGATLFKSGRVCLALERFKTAGELVRYIDSMKEPAVKQAAQQLRTQCEMNKALCFLKLQQFSEAKTACDAVLKDEPSNVKSLYRRACASLRLGDPPATQRDLQRLLEVDSQNREARALLKEAKAMQKEQDMASKGLFANMCKALGKGPIPEPAKRRDLDEGEDSDGDVPVADAPADGEATEPPGQGEKAPADGEAAEPQGQGEKAPEEAPPADCEAAPKASEEAPAEREAAPKASEEAPADGEAVPMAT